MSKKIIKEELNQMKYLFGYKRGVVISEQEIDEDKLVVTPYTLEATGGNIKITDTKTKKSYVYSLSAYGVKVTVNDFPDGDSINYTIPFKGSSTQEISNDSELPKLIKANVGTCELNPKVGGISVTLKCVSGCVGCKSSTEKVIDSTKDTLKSTASYLGF
jgi:DNA gyrase/topoisomerase IV subunit A